MGKNLNPSNDNNYFSNPTCRPLLMTMVYHAREFLINRYISNTMIELDEGSLANDSPGSTKYVNDMVDCVEACLARGLVVSPPTKPRFAWDAINCFYDTGRKINLASSNGMLFFYLLGHFSNPSCISNRLHETISKYSYIWAEVTSYPTETS